MITKNLIFYCDIAYKAENKFKLLKFKFIFSRKMRSKSCLTNWKLRKAQGTTSRQNCLGTKKMKLDWAKTLKVYKIDSVKSKTNVLVLGRHLEGLNENKSREKHAQKQIQYAFIGRRNNCQRWNWKKKVLEQCAR